MNQTTQEIADSLLKSSLDWLRSNYSTFCFFVERDIVWSIQTHLLQEIAKAGLSLRVFNDYGILPGSRRGLSADLVLIGENNKIEVAVEFKYEPAHSRTDIPRIKFPVVGWGEDGVAKDIQRIKEFVDSGLVNRAYAVFIDEGRYFRHRPAHPGSAWIDCESDYSVLWSYYDGITF